MPSSLMAPSLKSARNFYESWQGGISGEFWRQWDTLLGTTWTIGVNNGQLTNRVVGMLGDSPRLAGVHRWTQPQLSNPSSGDIFIQKTAMEFTICFNRLPGGGTTTNSLYGFGANQTDTRTSDNILGWCLSPTVGIVASGNYAGTGLTQSSVALGDWTINQWNLLRMEIIYESWNEKLLDSICKFYVNNKMVYRITSSNKPTGALYPVFYHHIGTGGNRTMDIGPVHIWQEVKNYA